MYSVSAQGIVGHVINARYYYFISQLDKERSPLLQDLMAFLHELMKDYKNEIKGEAI